MSDLIGWGIAATGGIAAQMASALEEVEGATLVAVGSRSSARAEAFAQEWGIDAEHAHGSYEALFRDTAVDVVYVAAPHSEHHRLTLAALGAGRHVLCEKAFALDADQAREMTAAARRHGRFLMEAMWTWFLPAIDEVRRRLVAGEIGEPKVLQADFALAVPGDTGRHRELALGGGALLDLGVYPVALAHHLLGPPRDVKALGALGPTGVDSTVVAVSSHPGGAFATLHTGLDARSSLGAEIVGTEGIIRIDPPFWAPVGFEVDHGDGDVDRVEMPHRGLAHEAAHVGARIRAGHLESDVVPLDTSVAIMETLDDIRRQVGVAYPRDIADRSGVVHHRERGGPAGRPVVTTDGDGGDPPR